MARHPTLADLLDELRRGDVVEAEIRSPTQHVDGLVDLETETIIVNPKPGLADTILHEATHRRYPRWGEARVRREVRWLIRHMTDQDVANVVRTYRRVARHQKTPVKTVAA